MLVLLWAWESVEAGTIEWTPIPRRCSRIHRSKWRNRHSNWSEQGRRNKCRRCRHNHSPPQQPASCRRLMRLLIPSLEIQQKFSLSRKHRCLLTCRHNHHTAPQQPASCRRLTRLLTASIEIQQKPSLSRKHRCLLTCRHNHPTPQQPASCRRLMRLLNSSIEIQPKFSLSR